MREILFMYIVSYFDNIYRIEVISVVKGWKSSFFYIYNCFVAGIPGFCLCTYPMQPVINSLCGPRTPQMCGWNNRLTWEKASLETKQLPELLVPSHQSIWLLTADPWQVGDLGCSWRLLQAAPAVFADWQVLFVCFSVMINILESLAVPDSSPDSSCCWID